MAENEDEGSYVTPDRPTTRRCRSKTPESKAVETQKGKGKGKSKALLALMSLKGALAQAKGHGRGAGKQVPAPSEESPGDVAEPKKKKEKKNKKSEGQETETDDVAKVPNKRPYEVERDDGSTPEAKHKKKKQQKGVEQGDESTPQTKDKKKDCIEAGDVAKVPKKKQPKDVEQDDESTPQTTHKKKKKQPKDVEQDDESTPQTKDGTETGDVAKVPKKKQRQRDDESTNHVKTDDDAKEGTPLEKCSEKKKKRKAKSSDQLVPEEIEKTASADSSTSDPKPKKPKTRVETPAHDTVEDGDAETLHYPESPSQRRRLKAAKPTAEEVEEKTKTKKASKEATEDKPAGGASKLRRSDTSTTVPQDGVVKGLAVRDGNGRLRRVKHLSDEQKEVISGLAAPSQLDVKERRCLYAAMDRRFNQGDLPASLMEKYAAAAGNHSKKFQLLKEFLLADEMRSVQIEGSVASKNRVKQDDIYVELPLFELEIRYGGTEAGRDFIQDIQKSQKGRPHPDRQFRNNPKYRVYKVYKFTEHKSGHENVAKTKMSKVAEVELNPPANADGDGSEQSGSPAKPDPKEEATKKAIAAMYDSMVPLSGKKSRKDSDDDTDDNRTRRRGRGQGQRQTPAAEESPEVQQQKQDKKDLEKAIRGVKSLANKARDASQTLHSLAGNEAMRTECMGIFQELSSMASGLENKFAKGSSAHTVLETYRLKRPEIEKYEDAIESAKSAANALKRRQEKKIGNSDKSDQGSNVHWTDDDWIEWWETEGRESTME